jgi:hypothetical protein
VLLLLLPLPPAPVALDAPPLPLALALALALTEDVAPPLLPDVAEDDASSKRRSGALHVTPNAAAAASSAVNPRALGSAAALGLRFVVIDWSAAKALGGAVSQVG